MNRPGRNIFQARQIFLAALLCLAFHARASISVGPKPQNAAEAEQRRKLLFDQAILSNQEKIRVGQERYAQQQAYRAGVARDMAAQLEARKQIVTIQAATAVPPSLAAQAAGWFKPTLMVTLLAVVFFCGRYLYRQRQ